MYYTHSLELGYPYPYVLYAFIYLYTVCNRILLFFCVCTVHVLYVQYIV